eukprot:1004587-Pleurochrysis_carterae.AAC.1
MCATQQSASAGASDKEAGAPNAKSCTAAPTDVQLDALFQISQKPIEMSPIDQVSHDLGGESSSSSSRPCGNGSSRDSSGGSAVTSAGLAAAPPVAPDTTPRVDLGSNLTDSSSIYVFNGEDFSVSAAEARRAADAEALAALLRGSGETHASASTHGDATGGHGTLAKRRRLLTAEEQAERERQ